MNEITIASFPDEKASFCGIAVRESCSSCGKEEDSNMFIIRGDNLRVILCKDCLEKLIANMACTARKMVKLNDVVWELTRCDDEQWRIFPMTVKSVNPYGQTRKTKTGAYETWNIYAEGDYTYMYVSFYDEGRRWFFTKEEAEESLRKAKSGAYGFCMKDGRV